MKDEQIYTKGGEITDLLRDGVEILNRVFERLPPNGDEEIAELKQKLKEIEDSSSSLFCELNRECIEFSQLNHIKKQLTKLSVLVVRCLVIAEYLEYSYSSFCNRFERDGK